MITARSISPLLLFRIHSPNLSLLCLHESGSADIIEKLSARDMFILLRSLFNAFLLCFPSPEVLSTIVSFVYVLRMCTCLFSLRATSGCLVGMM